MLPGKSAKGLHKLSAKSFLDENRAWTRSLCSIERPTLRALTTSPDVSVERSGSYWIVACPPATPR